VTGYGIHYGECLNIDKTDILFGDPINTASKLGMDIAEEGEIYISTNIYDKVR
jgi:class 3 adenylate cyclase